MPVPSPYGVGRPSPTMYQSAQAAGQLGTNAGTRPRGRLTFDSFRLGVHHDRSQEVAVKVVARLFALDAAANV